MKLNYLLSYDGEYSRVTIPELDGKTIKCRPNDNYVDDEYLDIEHFCYTANFDPYDSDIFTTIEIQKEGGDDQLARATSYYEQPTRPEADAIISKIIRQTLDIQDFELVTDSEDFIEENECFDEEDEEYKDNEEIESEIKALLADAEDDFDELDQYIENYETFYTEDIREFAFREAIRQGKAEYVEEHADNFDLNDTDGYSSYIYETEDDDIIEILMDHGAFKSIDDYDDYRFSMESINGTIVNFDSDFQREIFDKYLEKYKLTKSKIIELIESGENYDDEDFDRDLSDDMSSLGVIVENGELSFKDDMYGEYGEGLKELLEELGWYCSFEGDSWNFETLGMYFIE